LPSLSQFSSFFSEYQRKKRILQLANDKKEGKTISTEKPFVIKFGANHVTTLVEQKKAKLVVIANDVDPIEHV
jgi:large subunit ribosomal protein L7Ae